MYQWHRSHQVGAGTADYLLFLNPHYVKQNAKWRYRTIITFEFKWVTLILVLFLNVFLSRQGRGRVSASGLLSQIDFRSSLTIICLSNTCCTWTCLNAEINWIINFWNLRRQPEAELTLLNKLQLLEVCIAKNVCIRNVVICW